MQAINVFQPDILSVPTDAKGRPTFKLEFLAAANGFDHMAAGTVAHDAIGDVEATIHMCRILAEQTEEYWSNFVRFAQKTAVLDFAEEDKVFCLTDIFFGRVYSWMVTRLGPNPNISSRLLVFNLAIDPGQLADLPDDQLVARLATTPKPVRDLRVNACPCVLSYEDTPEHLRSQAPDLADLTGRAERIRSDDELVNRLIAAFLATREPQEPSGHVEEQIYDGFTGGEDQPAIAAFHAAEWSARPGILARLSDARLKVLGERLIYTEAPEVMTASELVADEDRGRPFIELGLNGAHQRRSGMTTPVLCRKIRVVLGQLRQRGKESTRFIQIDGLRVAVAQDCIGVGSDTSRC